MSRATRLCRRRCNVDYLLIYRNQIHVACYDSASRALVNRRSVLAPLYPKRASVMQWFRAKIAAVLSASGLASANDTTMGGVKTPGRNISLVLIFRPAGAENSGLDGRTVF